MPLPSLELAALIASLAFAPPEQGDAAQPEQPAGAEQGAPAGAPAPTEAALQPAQPQPQPQPQPQSEERITDPFAPQPQPAPAPQPAPQPAPIGQQPAPQTAPVGQQPTPVGPPAEPPTTGLGYLVSGPLLVAIGAPLSFLGNAAWRDNCGPTTSTGQCSDGSFASAAAHTFAGLSFGLGIGFTAIGGGRRGGYDARAGVPRSPTAFIAVGGLLLPTGLLGMGFARLFLWLPTPDCLEYECVQRHQSASTLIVSSLALVTSAGAGMLMYGAGYKRNEKYNPQVAVTPVFGPGMSGLGVGGRF